MTTEPPVPPEPTSAPQPPPEMPAATPPVAPATTQPAITTMSGESMVVGGAALVLGSYLVFSLIANEFHQYHTVVVAALLVLFVFFFREAAGKVVPVPTALKVLGYVIAAGGVFEIVEDLRFWVFDDFWEFLGAAIAYAGYVLAFFGAWTIKTKA